MENLWFSWLCHFGNQLHLYSNKDFLAAMAKPFPVLWAGSLAGCLDYNWTNLLVQQKWEKTEFSLFSGKGAISDGLVFWWRSWAFLASPRAQKHCQTAFLMRVDNGTQTIFFMSYSSSKVRISKIAVIVHPSTWLNAQSSPCTQGYQHAASGRVLMVANMSVAVLAFWSLSPKNSIFSLLMWNCAQRGF